MAAQKNGQQRVRSRYVPSLGTTIDADRSEGQNYTPFLKAQCVEGCPLQSSNN
jgi:hypothetical protein